MRRARAPRAGSIALPMSDADSDRERWLSKTYGTSGETKEVVFPAR